MKYILSIIIALLGLTCAYSKEWYRDVTEGAFNECQVELFHEAESSHLYGHWHAMYPEEGQVQSYYNITQFHYRDYNPYTSSYEIDAGGLYQDRIDIHFRSRWFRSFDLEVWIYGVDFRNHDPKCKMP